MTEIELHLNIDEDVKPIIFAISPLEICVFNPTSQKELKIPLVDVKQLYFSQYVMENLESDLLLVKDTDLLKMSLDRSVIDYLLAE